MTIHVLKNRKLGHNLKLWEQLQNLFISISLQGTFEKSKFKLKKESFPMNPPLTGLTVCYATKLGRGYYILHRKWANSWKTSFMKEYVLKCWLYCLHTWSVRFVFIFQGENGCFQFATDWLFPVKLTEDEKLITFRSLCRLNRI